MNYRPPGIETQLTWRALAEATATTIEPAFIWDSDALRTGGWFAIEYQGMNEDVAHSGNLSGFGFFRLYMGPGVELLGLALLGAVSVLAFRFAAGRGVAANLVFPYLLYTILFGGLQSGNWDLLIGGVLVQSCVACVWMAVALALGRLLRHDARPSVRATGGGGRL
jgi:hypothetical protein